MEVTTPPKQIIDVNLDGRITPEDKSAFIRNYLAATQENKNIAWVDVNRDGAVDETDFEMFINIYQQIKKKKIKNLNFDF